MDSVSSVEPATVAHDQPTPSRNSPAVTARRSPPEVPARSVATTYIACPSRITGTRPSRSAAHPTSGDSAYIPAMCRLIVNPTTLSDAPWWARCTGVIVITDTITAWPITSAVSPVRAAGRVITWRMAVLIRAKIAGCRRARPAAPATSRPVASAPRPMASRSGSGRSRSRMTAQPAMKAATEKTKVPAASGSARARATASPGPLRLGPRTLPTVVDQTTRDSERARVAEVARSAAA